VEELRFPEGKIPQQEPRVLSMDDYLEFVLFCRKNLPCSEERDMPSPVPFVIREEDEKYFSDKKKS
jgi:hypothetical protein